MNLRWRIAQAAEIRWWQNYLRKKPKANYLEWKLSYWEEMLQSLNIKFESQEQLLDAGCGPAGIFMALQDHKTDALDPLLDDYEEKLDHFSKELYPNIHFINAPLESYQAQKKYDKIFCINAINHVAELDKSIDHLFQMIRPGGQLIISVDAHNFWPLKKIFRLLPGDILHPHQYDIEEYQQMMSQRGAKIQQTKLYKKEFIFNYFVLVCEV